WVQMDAQNAERIVTVLKEFGFDIPELSVGLFLQENRIVRMGVPPVKIEIMTTISGVSFTDCYNKRVVDELDGVEVHLISLWDLKENKKGSGRYKDLNDLENLP
ncbi:MAG: hypothetical protein KJ638_07935, partial [Chloroflexi bacterium]|nr:hypothetical protein [Chloroflexota bacterium]